MTKGHVCRNWPNVDVARRVQSFELMQIALMIDCWGIGNAQPREARCFGPLGPTTCLGRAAREHHDPEVETIGHSEFVPEVDRTNRQWMAAYMIFSSVASSAENSSTTFPIRHTRMRSESAITSGK